MAAKDGVNGTTGAQAPGAKVVEALANQLSAGFTRAMIAEATAALREKYERDGLAMLPTVQFGLGALESHGEQLVTATTPAPTVEGGSR